MSTTTKTRAEGPPSHRGFRVGDRVTSTSPHGTAGLAGTVAEVKYAEPFHGGGDTGRLIVTVELDGGERTVFIADGDDPLPLERVSSRVHPGWTSVPAVEFYLATKARPYLAAVLDDMESDPAVVAAALRGVADVIDGGQVAP